MSSTPITRTYRTELQTADGAFVTDVFEAKNFTEAVAEAQEFRSQMRIGTRILSVMENDSYMQIIKDSRR